MREQPGFPILTLPDGTIDFDGYHAEAARLRTEAKRDFVHGMGRKVRGIMQSLRRLTFQGAAKRFRNFRSTGSAATNVAAERVA